MKRSEVLNLRKIIEQAAQSLPDETATDAVCLHPVWAIGVSYTAGFKVQHNERLWRCIQTHTSIEGWQPENTASLWEEINETHSGTIDNPIPYNGNMALVNGLYYVQDSVTYHCVRDTVNPVHNALSDLVGIYVDKV